MNAYQLFRESGDPVRLWCCGKCGTAYGDVALAAHCCEPVLCECGHPCEKPWTACRTCRDVAAESRQQGRWEKARPMSACEWRGMVYDDDADEWHNDVGCFLDAWYYEHGEDAPVTARVYASKRVSHHIDAWSIVESLGKYVDDGLYDEVDREGVETIQAQINAWVATLPDVFEPDFSVRIEFGGES